MAFAATVNGALRRLFTWPVYLAGLVPLAMLMWQATSGGLGVDPVKALERQLGLTALQLLLASLVITPLRRWTGVNLIRYRRAIGLLAFFYAGLHLLVWVTLDLQLRWAEIGADLVKRPYIIVGMLAFALLVPLAATSNAWSIRRLGALAWQKLHRLAYLAVLLGALHYLMLVKVWSAEPLLYAAGAAILVGLRALWLWKRPSVAAA
jgi:sulfoxide reductase heme-binding subunit YedZ